MASDRYREQFALAEGEHGIPDDPFVSAHGRWASTAYPYDAFAAIAAGRSPASFYPAFYREGGPENKRASYGAPSAVAVALGESDAYTALIDGWGSLFGRLWDIVENLGDDLMVDESGQVDDPAGETRDDVKKDASMVVLLLVAVLVVVVLK